VKKSFSLTILEIIEESIDTKSIIFKLPKFKKFEYSPGQYLTIGVRINGRKYFRPYSISSCPFTDENIKITVKKIESGIVSSYIHNQFKIGDIVEIIQPTGDFYNPEKILKASFFWGAGSGIAPLFSIIKSVLFQGIVNEVFLIYSSRDIENIIFKTELEKLEDEYFSKFRVFHFLSRSNENDNKKFKNYRLKEDNVSEFLGNHINSTHFICGPKEFSDMIYSSLASKGVSASNINLESFYKLEDEILPENVVKSSAEFYINNSKIEFEIPRGKTLLDVLIENNVDVDYSCKNGSCNFCICKLVKGELYMDKSNHNKFDTDEFLLCSSYPKTKEISIKI
jgi:ring-1,2-phenylacetyl-CoA epoxidase subunit PaaE